MKLIALATIASVSFVSAADPYNSDWVAPQPTATTGISCDGNPLICDRGSECCGYA